MSTAKNTFMFTKKISPKMRNMATFSFVTVAIMLLLSLLLLTGCGDYYVNVDKEAVKMEIDSLIDKEALDGLR